MLQVYTVPNVLSAIRIVLMPFVVWAIAWDSAIGIFAALCVVSFAEILDLADGYIARTRNVVSDLGKLLDPLADTLFHISIYVAFMKVGVIDLWMVVLLFTCTICVSYYRTVAASNGFVMAARPWGKIKANFQAYGALLIIVLLAYQMLWEAGEGVSRAVLFGMLGTTFVGILAFLAFFQIKGRPLGHALISVVAVGLLAVGLILRHSWELPIVLLCKLAGALVCAVTAWSFVDYTRFFIQAYADWGRRQQR